VRVQSHRGRETAVDDFKIEEIMRPEQLPGLKDLFEEYWHSLGFSRETFGFGIELDGLPGVYTRPKGRLATANVSGRAVGCVALRPLDADACEFKRLFVRDEARGKGVAARLLSWLVEEARAEGYSRMLADTLPPMTAALHLYKKFGFKRVGPYSANPTPGAVYLEMNLR
jgi:putative acetyltransferase